MSKAPPKLALKMPDYVRLHRVISSVLNSVEANTPKACLFFAVAGAFIIETVHKRPARPVVGAAFYRVDDKTGFTVAFGRLEHEAGLPKVSSDEDAFHCWIESDGIAIDLMAPIFQESVLAEGRPERVPRKMFQKQIQGMSASPYDLEKEGDFYFEPNPELGLGLIEGFMESKACGDLANVCHHWYRPNPKGIPSSLRMGSADGGARNIRLSPVELLGAW